jgi:hypothetical protein
MKKLLLPICLFLAGVNTANAQSFSIGARAGLNFANISESGSGSASYSTRTSFLLGGYLGIMFTEKMGLQPELFYSSVGASESNPSSGTTTLKLGYISIPVFFRYNFNDMFHILAGPQVGILASAKATNGGTTIDFKDYTNSSDFSAVIGIGLDFGPINAGLRYSAGLSNISKNSGGTTDKNNVLQLVAGYRLFKK